MKKIVLFLIVLLSVPSVAQEVIVDTLNVVENEIVSEINLQVLDTIQADTLIYNKEEIVEINEVSNDTVINNVLTEINIQVTDTIQADSLIYNKEEVVEINEVNEVVEVKEVSIVNDTVEMILAKEMTIVSDHEKDKVFIDGEMVGITPCTIPVSYGTHELKIKRGKHVYEQMFTVDNDGIDEIEIKLGKVVIIKTTNKGDKIYVDNKYVGKTPLKKYLYYGDRQIKMVRNNNFESVQTITVDDDNDEYTLYLGQLVVLESNKEGDDVYIDGVKRGDSPLEYDMPFGKHEVMVKRHRRMDTQKIYVAEDGQTHFYFYPTKESITEFNNNGLKFFMLNASLLEDMKSYGISWGSYKKVGWHISLLTNFDDVNGKYQTGLTQFIGNYNDVSSDMVSDDFTSDVIRSRVSATAGLMFRMTGPMYLKLGGGYAMYSTFAQTVDEGWYKSIDGVNYNGLLLTGGLQFNLKNFVISADLNTTKDFDFMEFKLGVGFAKKKNKKK